MNKIITRSRFGFGLFGSKAYTLPHIAIKDSFEDLSILESALKAAFTLLRHPNITPPSFLAESPSSPNQSPCHPTFTWASLST